MTLSVYQVDAFTDKPFGGNPACVVPLNSWLPDNLLLTIAGENAVAETAFFIPTGECYALRWFTPDIEMDLCGHATLATAHVLFNHMGYSKDVIHFNTASGMLPVQKEGGLLVLDFPNRKPLPASLPKEIRDGLNILPKEVYKARDYVLLYDSEEDIRRLAPDKTKFDQINLDPGGIVATAKGNAIDFVSRFFTPQASIFEDPVTGSAHCSLAPFWAERLGKNVLEAAQLSARQGRLICEIRNDRVLIKGQAVTVMAGQLMI